MCEQERRWAGLWLVPGMFHDAVSVSEGPLLGGHSTVGRCSSQMAPKMNRSADVVMEHFVFCVILLLFLESPSVPQRKLRGKLCFLFCTYINLSASFQRQAELLFFRS